MQPEEKGDFSDGCVNMRVSTQLCKGDSGVIREGNYGRGKSYREILADANPGNILFIPATRHDPHTCGGGTLKWDRLNGFLWVVVTDQLPARKIRTFKFLFLRPY